MSDDASATDSHIAPLTLGEAVRVELACLAEFSHFIRRHRRYAVIFVLLYWHSLSAWRARRGLRVAFCLAQRLDDILDGDRPTQEPPLAVAARVRRQIACGSFPDSREGLLARAVAWELDARASASESPREEFLALIDTLCCDRGRIDARRVLERAALDAQLAATFTRSLNLQLILAGSRIRARDVAAIISCFGRCSILRDLDEDLGHGLVNLPRELLDACAISNPPESSRPLRRHAAFREWVLREARQSLAALDDAEKSLAAWPDRQDPGLRILGIFTRSMRDFFSRRVFRLYPEIRSP